MPSGSGRVEWSVGAALLLCACGSSPLQNGSVPDGGEVADATVPNDGPSGVDSSIPDAGNGDENPPATACTAPPFVNFSATVTELQADDSMPVLPGATVTFSTCPNFDLTTNESGQASAQITKGIAISPIYTASGVIDAIGAEIPAGGDVEVTPMLISIGAAAAIPSFASGGSAPTIMMTLVATGTSTCAAIDGVAFSVTGHPEAIIDYMGPNWPTDTKVADAGKPAVSVGPVAFISGIQLDAGASSVTLTAGKVLCHVQIATASQTGNFQLVSDAITIGIATVTN